MTTILRYDVFVVGVLYGKIVIDRVKDGWTMSYSLCPSHCTG